MPNFVLNIILVGVLLLAAAIGAGFGFGRMLKFTTSGIAGIVISVVLIALFGMALLATPAINGLVATGNEFFAGVWGFLGVIHLATVLYFIALFIVLQVLRIIIVLIIRRVTEIDKKPIKIANKILGAVYFVLFVFMLFLLILATIRFFEYTFFNYPESIMQAIEGSWIYVIFRNNFIVFGSSAEYCYPYCYCDYVNG